jgi:hypothetical protein
VVLDGSGDMWALCTGRAGKILLCLIEAGRAGKSERIAVIEEDAGGYLTT